MSGFVPNARKFRPPIWGETKSRRRVEKIGDGFSLGHYTEPATSVAAYSKEAVAAQREATTIIRPITVMAATQAMIAGTLYLLRVIILYACRRAQ